MMEMLKKHSHCGRLLTDNLASQLLKATNVLQLIYLSWPWRYKTDKVPTFYSRERDISSAILLKFTAELNRLSE